MKIRKTFKQCLFAFALFAMLLPCPSYAEPIHMKNHNPIWFGIIFPTPDSADVLEKGENKFSTDFDYSSIFFFKSNPDWDMNFDMEIAQVTLNGRAGIGYGMEVGAELPIYRLSGGFLDSSIINFHKAMGLPTYESQVAAPRDKYSYSLKHKGVAWNAPKADQPMLGDVNLWAKKKLLETDNLILSIKGLVQVPSGSTSNGLGSGDVGSGAMIMAKNFSGKNVINLTIGRMFPGTMNRGEKFTMQDFSVVFGGWEYLYSNRWTLYMQGTSSTSPFFGRDWSEITFGFSYITDSKRKITFGFLEDLSNVGPDFTAHLSISF